MFESLTQRLTQVFQKLKGQGYLTEADVRAGLREIRLALLAADVHYQAVKEILADIEREATGKRVLGSLSPGQQLVGVVRECLARVMGGQRQALHLTGRPAGILVVGPAGGGKTTTVAKLGHMLKKRGKSVALVCADPRRSAAADQLRSHAEQLGVAFRDATRDPLSETMSVRAEAKKALWDVVIVDTSGVPPGESPPPALSELAEALSAGDTLLVLDALVGQEAAHIAEAFLPLGVTGVVLSKLDGDARGGAALSVPARTGRPVLFVGMGERPEDLESFHPERMADRILGLGDLQGLAEQMTDVGIPQVEAAKVREGSLTLDDFLQQLESVQRAGPISQFLSRIPGFKAQADDDELERGVRRSRAILQSMTVEERRNPNIIGASRKRRIARGSGTSVQEVNRLLAQYEGAVRLARQLGRRRMPPGFENLGLG